MWEECTQEESQLVSREEKMGEDDDQALTTHANKGRKKREDRPHIRPKIFKNNNRSQRDYTNIRCFACDEKGNFAKDYPKNKGSTMTNNKMHHAHIVEEDEPERKRTKEDSSSDEEYVL